MLAAECDQCLDVDFPRRLGQFVQRQDQRRIVEEVRGLFDLGRELFVETFDVVAGQLQHGDGEHAALELEGWGLVGEVGLAHGLPAAVNGEDL